MLPMVTTVHRTIPNTTGSMPKLWTIGRRIGVVKRIITDPSINIPATTRRRTIKAITTNGLEVKLITAVVNFCGSLSIGIPYPNTPDMDIINIMEPISIMEFFIVLKSTSFVSFL